MASATRRRKHHYVGAPWSRSTGSQKSTKMERTKGSKEVGVSRSFVLPLVVKSNGRWGYKFGKMRKRLRERVQTKEQ